MISALIQPLSGSRLVSALLPLVGLVVLATPSAAQNASVSVNQLHPDDARSTTAPQISGGARTLPVAPATDRRLLGDGPSAPLSVSAPAPVSQLSQAAPSAEGARQLSDGQPSAEAPVSGTSRAQGRNTSAQALAGSDRCDPRRPARIRTSTDCDQVIETRASEFRAPDVQPLSAEQRLLIAQRELDDRSRDVGDAARRLGNGRIDEDNAPIAFVALNQRPPTDDDDKPEELEPTATDAIVAAILSGIGTSQPPVP